MRIVHLSPSYLPIVGGTEIYINNLAIYLEKFGISNKIITFSEKEKWRITNTIKQNDEYGIRTFVWPSYSLKRFQLLTRLFLKINCFPVYNKCLIKYLTTYDILHFHDDVDLSFPLSTINLDKPKLFSCHSLPYWVGYYQINLLARALFSKSADLYHVFSKVDKYNLIKLAIPESKIRVVPHGVDVKKYIPSKKKNSSNFINIVFIGRISKQKGIINILKAVDILKNNYYITPKINIKIVGKIWDYNYFYELINYKRMKQLDEIKFMGFIENITAILQQSDIFICPSLQETFGIVNLEAMACELPVIATRVGAMPDIINNNKTGFIIPPNDPVKLAEKLYILINDEQLRKHMGREGRKRIVSNYSMEKITRKMIEIYKELIH